MRKLYEGAYQLDLPVAAPINQVYVYLIVAEKITLIDTGVPTEACKRALDEQLAKLGLSLAHIDQIVLTHHHYDHWAGIEFFDTNTPVYLHQRFKRVSEVEAQGDFMKQSFDRFVEQLGLPRQYGTQALQIFKVDSYHLPFSNLLVVKDGDTIPFTGGLQVLEIPGHASTQIGLFSPARKVFFSADVLMHNQNLSVWLEQMLPEDQVRVQFMPQYVETLKRLKTCQFETLYPGHGLDIENIDEQIETRLVHLETKKEQVLKKITTEPQTIWEVYAQLYSPRFIARFFTLTFAEIVGMIDLLCQDGKVEMEEAVTPFQVRRK